jgi:hypothetical protein
LNYFLFRATHTKGQTPMTISRIVTNTSYGMTPIVQIDARADDRLKGLLR